RMRAQLKEKSAPLTPSLMQSATSYAVGDRNRRLRRRARSARLGYGRAPKKALIWGLRVAREHSTGSLFWRPRACVPRLGSPHLGTRPEKFDASNLEVNILFEHRMRAGQHSHNRGGGKASHEPSREVYHCQSGVIRPQNLHSKGERACQP